MDSSVVLAMILVLGIILACQAGKSIARNIDKWDDFHFACARLIDAIVDEFYDVLASVSFRLQRRYQFHPVECEFPPIVEMEVRTVKCQDDDPWALSKLDTTKVIELVDSILPQDFQWVCLHAGSPQFSPIRHDLAELDRIFGLYEERWHRERTRNRRNIERYHAKFSEAGSTQDLSEWRTPSEIARFAWLDHRKQFPNPDWRIELRDSRLSLRTKDDNVVLQVERRCEKCGRITPQAKEACDRWDCPDFVKLTPDERCRRCQAAGGCNTCPR